MHYSVESDAFRLHLLGRGIRASEFFSPNEDAGSRENSFFTIYQRRFDPPSPSINERDMLHVDNVVRFAHAAPLQEGELLPIRPLDHVHDIGAVTMANAHAPKAAVAQVTADVNGFQYPSMDRWKVLAAESAAERSAKDAVATAERIRSMHVRERAHAPAACEQSGRAAAAGGDGDQLLAEALDLFEQLETGAVEFLDVVAGGLRIFDAAGDLVEERSVELVNGVGVASGLVMCLRMAVQLARWTTAGSSASGLVTTCYGGRSP